MKVLRPRSRMISVRLSEEEYSALRRLCFVTGARSVSDLTRDAVNGFLRGVSRVDALGTRSDDVLSLIKNLDRKMQQLAAEFSAFKAERSN